MKSMEHGVQGEIIDGCSPANLSCLQDKAIAERSELKALDQVQKIAENNVKFAKGHTGRSFGGRRLHQTRAKTRRQATWCATRLTGA